MRVRLYFLCSALVLGACTQESGQVTVYPADAYPERLGDWHLMRSDGRRLQLNDTVLPYELNTPLFSDYALKLRTVWMPEGEAAVYDNDAAFDFPVGTILSKTFHYQKSANGTFAKLDTEATLETDGTLNLETHRLVETRLLIRYADGWQALPYVWNETQTDAFLEIAGTQFEFTFAGDNNRSESFDYIVPDMNQCAACHVSNHTSKEVQPLGPKAHQLNREFAYSTGSVNQLDYWAEAGRISGVPSSIPRSPRWTERGREDRNDVARAYLDVNCAHCHNPEGPADTSALNLNLTATVDRNFGVCKPPVAVGRGSGSRSYDIYPGRPEESILIYRMQHDDPAIMMPELGRAMSHDEGVAAIQEWIAALPGNC